MILGVRRKKRGRSRTDASCRGFQDFIEKMNMEGIGYIGRQGTWANNRREEGCIEARLDRFLGQASGW